MLLTDGPELFGLDLPTLMFAAVFMAGMLGMFLLVAWFQDRGTQALAWWGSAYLIGASSMILWSAPHFGSPVPQEVPRATLLIACGMVWTGVRLFNGRGMKLWATFAGAAFWVVICLLPDFERGSSNRIAAGALIVTAYAFLSAWEMWRERRKSVFSRTAAIIVPLLHASIFLVPITMIALVPVHDRGAWMELFALEVVLYALGSAFLMLVMAKDRHVTFHRRVASTDALTGLCNRRAFLEQADALHRHQTRKRESITVLMFDLDHFKSINDRFGHAVGDDALRVFAETARTTMRAGDLIGRLGGEEFAAVVPAAADIAAKVAERVRAAFEAAGVTISGHAIGSTVSIGAAGTSDLGIGIEALLAQADAALYRSKKDGRNRITIAQPEPPPSEAAKLISAARHAAEKHPHFAAPQAKAA